MKKPKVFSASGNIFTLIDNRKRSKNENYFVENITELCNIKEQKTDGLIVINDTKEANFEVLFFNPDGTTGMMCGNGGRCAVYYHFRIDKTFNFSHLVSFYFNKTKYYGGIDKNNNKTFIFLDMPDKFEKRTVKIDDIEFEGIFTEINNTPHFVIETENIETIDIKKLGQAVRNHKLFKPAGVNANFYQKINENTIQLRTFERGVENETGACGTGAAASYIAFNSKYALTGKLKIIPTSKSELYAEYSNLNHIKKIILIGDVKEIVGS